MVETRQSGKSTSTPPRLTSLPKRGKVSKKLTTLDTPDSDATKPLTSSVLQEHNKCHGLVSHPIQSVLSITRFCLCHWVKKISEISSAGIEYGKELPQDVIDKIMLLYNNQIERQCSEVGLMVAKEAQWDDKEASVDEDEISNSGDESEEHDTDNVCFYSDADNDDNKTEHTSDDKQKKDAKEGHILFMESAPS